MVKKRGYLENFKKRMSLFIKKNCWQQVLLYSAAGVCVSFGLAYFFYRSWLAVILLYPVGLAFTLKLDEWNKVKNKEKMKIQFREMILVVSTNLRAGYAVPNAFLETRTDMIRLYGNNGQIVRELLIIEKGLQINQTIEELLSDFAKRSELEEIMEFSEIFNLAGRMGGNLREIIEQSASLISEKIEVDQEIQVMTRQSRLEQHLMSVVPFAIILYIDLTNPGYFDVLYHNTLGNIIMSFCLLGYLASLFMAEKIMKIVI